MTRGRFTIIDGLDGVGKGEVLDAIKTYLEKEGKVSFDLHHAWELGQAHPDFQNEGSNAFISLDTFDVLISSEPTYVGVGLAIREEIIAKNGREYSASDTAQSYALDRLILYKRVILPALAAGKEVIQSRSVSTSIVYQSLQSVVQEEEPLTVEAIMALKGNAVALDNAPNLFIIPTIKDVETVMQRIEERDKDDQCEFENLEFQLKLKPLYESDELREIFEQRGTIVKYLDAGISVEETRRQAVDIYSSILK